MSNFDDLFEQQPQKEAAPRKQDEHKERPKRQWWQIREEKQRKEAYASLDKIFADFADGKGNMEAYLDIMIRALNEEQGNPPFADGQNQQARPLRLCGSGADSLLHDHHGICRQRPADGHQ